MLTVQRMISSVEADVRNGSSQRRYHGNTAGANKREAAMGQANMGQINWSGDHSCGALTFVRCFCAYGGKRAGVPAPHSGDVLLDLSHAAVANPASTASPASNCGGTTRANSANTGALKRKVCTYLPSEPTGIRP